MPKQRPPSRPKCGHSQSKRTTVETDSSSENNSATYSDDSDNWFSDDIQPSDSASASASAAPGDSPTPPTAPDTNLPVLRRMEDPSQGWTGDGLRGHPLVPHNGMQYPGPNTGQGSSQAQRPSYPAPDRYNTNGTHVPMMYPSNSVQYPAAPNMQGIGVSGADGPPRPKLYHPENVNGYYPQQLKYADKFPPYTRMPYQFPTPPPPTATPPTPRPPKEDPEKIRLEAEIAAFKAIEDKAKAAEKQKEAEAKVRIEAEANFHRRMLDMRLAQEEATKELDKARLEAEKFARERMEAERKVEEKRAEEHARAMAQAEKVALERLRAERESEEERSKRFEEFAVNLERDVRAKVEMEKRADLAERDAKARQSEDLERLAKMKMLQSMDEIVILAKKRVLHDLAIDGESDVAKERQGWLIETRPERDTERGVVWKGDSTGKDQLSIPRASIPPRHATVSTVHSASSSSVKLPGVSPTPTWKSDHPEAPDPPGSSFESDGDGEVMGSRAGTNPFRPSRSDHKSRAYQKQNMFEGQKDQDTYRNPEFSYTEELIDRIADAVTGRLMHSSYLDLLMHHRPQTGQYHRQHIRHNTNPFAPATETWHDSKRQFGDEENPNYFPQGSPPCGPSRRFYVPPKPAHLRGRSIRGSNGPPSLDLHSQDTPASQQRIPVRKTKSRSSMLRSPPPPPPPPLDAWLDSSPISGQFESQTSYSEVDTVTQESPTTHVDHTASVVGSVTTWKHPDPWIEEAVPEAKNMPSMFGEVRKGSLQAFLAKKVDKDDIDEAYKYVFKKSEPLSARLPIGVGY
ncbi:hypothetical protein ACHAPA_008105 [Fusarium lateritium]